MENTEIMENEVTEVAEHVATSSGNGWKTVGIAGIAVCVAYGGYKLIKKLRNRKQKYADVVEPTLKDDEDVCVECVD